MAFIAEDGTGLSDANSYVELAFADSYFEERGNAAWTGTNSAKQAWLIQATDYVELVFGSRWIGDGKLSAAQGLSWPRTFEGKTLEAPDPRAGVPLSLMRAVCEYAVRAIAAPLLPDPVVDVTGFNVVTKKKKVGPIEKEFEVPGMRSRPTLIRSYPGADGLLASLLRPSGSSQVSR